MIVVVCPGQGAQTPGFLLPWLDEPAFRTSIESMQAASGIDLVAHGTVSDADTIRDTAIAQPLIVSAGVATLSALFGAHGNVSQKISGVAGHSVGEITAAVASGIFTAEQGIRFVRERGDAMALAAGLEPTSMAAVLGGEQSVVEARLSELGLEPANYNGGGQIVAAGDLDAIAQLAPEGARVRPLAVAGAFHTSYMQPAVEPLRTLAQSLATTDPAVSVISNRDGEEVSDGREILNRIVSQIASPVRWDLCMQRLATLGVTGVIEVAPAGTLVGLIKRAVPTIEQFALKTPADIDAAREFAAAHGGI